MKRKIQPSTAARTVLHVPRDLRATVRNFYLMVSLLIAKCAVIYLFISILVFLFYIQSLALTACQNQICRIRACYFSDSQPCPQSKTGDFENILKQNGFRKPEEFSFHGVSKYRISRASSNQPNRKILVETLCYVLW